MQLTKFSRMTDQEVAAAIVRELGVPGSTKDPSDVIKALVHGGCDPWQVRQVIWNLTAAGKVDLTWDRRLKLNADEKLAAQTAVSA